MLAEYEMIHSFYNILLILRILTIQGFNEFRLDETLFVQPLLIFQNF